MKTVRKQFTHNSKKIITFFLLLSIIFLYNACKKNNDIKENTKSVNEATAAIGKIHNNGLDYVANSIKLLTNRKSDLFSMRGNNKLMSLQPSLPNGSSSVNEDQVTSLMIAQNAAASVARSIEFVNITLDDPIGLTNKLDEIRANFNEAGVQTLWNSSVNDSKINNLVSSREKNMVDEVTQIFDDINSQNLTPNQTHDFLKSKLEALRSKYAEITYQENEGELFNGLINIALSSNDYWYNISNSIQLVNNANSLSIISNNKIMSINKVNVLAEPIKNDPIIVSPYFIQVDCIGYITGWVSALWDDYHSKGGIKSSGQGRRIGQGLIWGIGSSSFGLIKTVYAEPSPKADPNAPIPRLEPSDPEKIK